VTVFWTSPSPIKVTIPSLFPRTWGWNVYGISGLALQAAEYRHDQGVEPVAMVSANFRIKNFTTSTNGSAPEVDLAVVNKNSNSVSILLSSVDQAGNVHSCGGPKLPFFRRYHPRGDYDGRLECRRRTGPCRREPGRQYCHGLAGKQQFGRHVNQAQGSPLPTATTPAES